MASGAQVSEEAGGVGGEIEVGSESLVAGETGEDVVVAGGEIGVASGNQVDEETGGGGGGGIGVDSTDRVTGKEGTGDGGEIGVAHADQVTENAEGKTWVASENRIGEETGGLGGEPQVASENKITLESGGVGGDTRVFSPNQGTGEAGGLGGEIAVTSENQIAEEAGKLRCETGVASPNHVAGEAGGGGGEIGVAAVNEVNGEPGGGGGDSGVASANILNGEPGGGGGDSGVASANILNGEPGGGVGEIGVASVNLLNGEPGSEDGKIGVASANVVNREPGGGGGEIGVASVNPVDGEPGGGNGQNALASANQVNGDTGGGDGENIVASANLVNGEPGAGGGEVSMASAKQVNGQPGDGDGEIGMSSADHVNGEPGNEGGHIGVASANHVNGEPGDGVGEIGAYSLNLVNGVEGRAGVELGAGEKHRWAETKVYRRRSKGEKNKGVLSDLTTATVTLMDNANRRDHNKISEVNTHEINLIDEGTHNNNQVDGNGVVESDKVVSVLSSGDNAMVKLIQPETMEQVISNPKDLSSAMVDSVTPILIDPPVANGALRPPYSASDSKVKIHLSSTAKPELRELKRKFESELSNVRKAVKKMDGSREEVVPDFFHPVGSSSVILNGARSNGFATRVYSGTRSLGHVPYKPNIRPFNQLRVSVIENGHGMVDSIEREKRTPKANQFYRNSEFLLANDKFPPAESNKKSKSNGKKSSGGEFGFGVGSKVYKSCSALLEKLMKHKHGWVFNAPVDVKGLGLHDYFLIIKNPMDLGTVKAKLIKYWYKSPMEFAEDVRLTFHNAMLYNPKGHDVHIMAETLLKIFEGKWPDIEVKYLRELRMAVETDMGFPTPTSRITNPFQSPVFPPPETRVFNRSESMPHPVNPKPRTLTPAPSFRTPALQKPKAKDVNKRDMTYDEKQKLSTNLQSLPPEKLDGVIQIIKKRSTALSQNDDEIEVDIDSVDTETLWELDRFVTNYKKSLSKNRRKAELAIQMRADSRQAAEKITIPQPMPLKESTAGYGNATLPLPPHRNDPTANASGSSSSSSSSSSGSSSSDSESDSSSEESDGGHSPGT